MNKQAENITLTFDPKQVMDEWRRLYDWAVLSRKHAENIEMISCLGQKFSGILNAYRLTKKPQRRERLLQELIRAFEAMKTFYEGLPQGDRLRLTFHANDTP
jgi:hypothetical protein